MSRPISTALLIMSFAPPALAGLTVDSRSMYGGAIITRDETRAYLVNEQGGVDAVDLATSDLVWTNDQMAEPLATLSDDRLLVRMKVPTAWARSNEAQLSIWNTDATLESKLEPLVFPSWVRADFKSGLAEEPVPGSGFEHAVVAQGDALDISWDAWMVVLSGMPSEEPAEGRSGHGFFRIDPSAGQVTSAAWQDGSHERKAKEQFADGKRVEFRQELEGKEYVVYVDLYDPSGEEPAESFELARGQDAFDVQIPGDGRDDEVSLVVRSHARGPWQLYRLPSRDVQATIPYIDTELPVYVAATSLYTVRTVNDTSFETNGMLVPRRLRAVDLRSGQTRWERPIAPRQVYSLPPSAGPGVHSLGASTGQ